MRIVMVLFLAVFLLTGHAFGAKQYVAWYSHYGTALTAGNRGMIVPLAEDPALEGLAQEITQEALLIANGKAMNYLWSLANGFTTADDPMKIGEKIGNQADFFVIIKPKFEPARVEHFDFARLSYTAREDWEITRKEYDEKGKLKRDEHYTMPINSHTAYVDVPGADYRYDPLYMEIYVYDTSGALILSNMTYNIVGSRKENIQKALQYLFSYVKDYKNESDTEKIKGDDKVDVKNINVWKKPDFEINKKDIITVDPVRISAPAILGMDSFAKVMERTIWGYANEYGLMPSHSKGKYKLEMDIINAGFTLFRCEPRVGTTTRSETVEDRVHRHHDHYTDINRTIRHITTGYGISGQIGIAFPNQSVVFRLFEVGTGKLAFSFSASVDANRISTGFPLMVDKFFKKLTD